MANVGENNEEWVKVSGEWDREYFINRSGVVRYYFESRQSGKYKYTPDRYKYLKPHHYKIGYGNGYIAYRMSKNKISHIKYIHRLLALTFLPNPNNYPQINHIDGDSLNNSLTNLEWCTCKHNINHAWDNGLVKKVGKGYAVRITEDHVTKVRFLRKYGVSFENISWLIGLNYRSVSDIINKNKRFKNTFNEIS